MRLSIQPGVIEMKETMMHGLNRLTANNAAAYWLFVLVLVFFQPLSQAMPGTQKFDHLTTGFPLTGLHARIDCESCHMSGVFKGTPRQCRACHARGTRVSATLPPEDAVHLMSQQLECSNCHKTAGWTAAQFDHMGINSNCLRCHASGGSGQAAPNDLVHAQLMGADCSECHRSTRSFSSGARLDHAGITSGCEAVGCHADDKARTRGHASLIACQNCHSYPVWNNVRMDHNAIGATQCRSCHVRGGNAMAAPADQLHANVASQDCSVCHSTTTFVGATIDHSLIVTGCGVSGCHAADKATAPNHTSLSSCESCHRYPSWTSVTMNHNAVGTTQCKSCHRAGGIATTAAPGDALHSGVGSLDCSTCHTTTTFVGGRVDHAFIVTGCGTSGCHAANKASAPNHSSLNSCESCHRYPNWTSVTMSHNAIGATTCKSCHVSGGLATTSAPADQIHANIGTQDCSACHTTATFLGAGVDHSTITSGCNKAGCHAADQASAPSPSHATLNSCQFCHRYPSWASVTMSHNTSAIGGTRCDSCHRSGGIARGHPNDGDHRNLGTKDCSACHSTRGF
jgi:hypothetical protein